MKANTLVTHWKKCLVASVASLFLMTSTVASAFSTGYGTLEETKATGAVASQKDIAGQKTGVKGKKAIKKNLKDKRSGSTTGKCFYWGICN